MCLCKCVCVIYQGDLPLKLTRLCKRERFVTKAKGTDSVAVEDTHVAVIFNVSVDTTLNSYFKQSNINIKYLTTK